MQSWHQIQFQDKEIKDWKNSYTYHKKQLSCETDTLSIRYLQLARKRWKEGERDQSKEAAVAKTSRGVL